MRPIRAFAGAVAALAAMCAALPATAQAVSDVKMVVVVSRHGVRSPSHPAELQAYAAQPLPKWDDAPGFLTPRGAMLMRQFGAAYRRQYATVPGLASSGCPAPGAVFVWADVDERTRATGDAFLAGFAPGCRIEVGHAAADNDSLFDPLPEAGTVDAARTRASLVGAVGGDPDALVTAYAPALATMETVLGCSPATSCRRISGVPSAVNEAGDGGLAELTGGIAIAADVAENFLLEYTDGRPSPGWGRLDPERLLQMLQVHVLDKKLEHGNLYAARAHSSNILAHILQTLREGATGAPVAGTRVPPQSRFVFLAGHDTQLAELAGLLQLSWIVRGDAFNDTPPGAALVFEVHEAPQPSGEPFVRTFFTAQSLDAMRAGHGENPERVPVYVPGCPGLDCPFSVFERVANSALDPALVLPWK